MSPAERRAHAYKKKLRGGLSYAGARFFFTRHVFQNVDEAACSEVFVIVSLTLFLPICLEQFARDNGYFMPDRKVPCVVSKHSLNTTMAVDSSQDADLRCAVKVAWFWIDSASFR